MTKSTLFFFAAAGLLIPSAARADIILYTIDINATAYSAATSVSYVSGGYVTDPFSYNFTPNEITVLSAPAADAALNANPGNISNTQYGLVFNENNLATWIFDASVAAPITSPGIYPFATAELSTGLDPFNTYYPGGQVVVQELTTPTYLYTESFDATQHAAATSFSFEAPAFFDDSVGEPLYGSQVNLLALPVPGAVPTSSNDFYVGGDQAAAEYVDSRGNTYFFEAGITPFYTPGTYAYSSALVYYNGNPLPDTGTVTVTAIAPAPEPASGLLCLGGMLIAMAGVKRTARRS